MPYKYWHPVKDIQVGEFYKDGETWHKVDGVEPLVGCTDFYIHFPGKEGYVRVPSKVLRSSVITHEDRAKEQAYYDWVDGPIH